MSMEFFSERLLNSRKEHICEMCLRKINPGDYYFREAGKWCGEFFSRGLHVQCHLMEVDYCTEVDCEFSWDGIEDYIADEYCSVCEHSAQRDEEEGWSECKWDIHTCPTILKRLSDKYKFSTIERMLKEEST